MKTASVELENGITVDAAAACIRKLKNEDEFVLCTDVAKTLETGKAEWSSGRVKKDKIPQPAMGHIASLIRQKVGILSIFALLDGHYRKYSFGANLISALGLEFEEQCRTVADQRVLLEQTAIHLPKRLHFMVREHLKNQKGALQPGSTLSFLLMTGEWTVQGLIGDSPIVTFSTKGRMRANDLHSIQNASERKLKAGFGIQIYSREGAAFAPMQGRGLRMCNSLGSFFWDRDWIELFHQYCTMYMAQDLSQRLKKEGCEVFRDAFGSFFEEMIQPERLSSALEFLLEGNSQSPNFDRDPGIFDRLANIKTICTAKLAGAAICSDGFGATKAALMSAKLFELLTSDKSAKAILRSYKKRGSINKDDSTLLIVKIKNQ